MRVKSVKIIDVIKSLSRKSKSWGRGKRYKRIEKMTCESNDEQWGRGKKLKNYKMYQRILKMQVFFESGVVKSITKESMGMGKCKSLKGWDLVIRVQLGGVV